MRDAARHCRRPATITTDRVPERPPLQLTAWRYCALEDVAYERRTLLLGGPILMPLTAIASALGNRRRRQDAERAAAPQWWPIGPVVVEVRPDRLLVHWNGQAGTVWLASVTRVFVDEQRGFVDLTFTHDPPYRFGGHDAARLGVFLKEVRLASV